MKNLSILSLFLVLVVTGAYSQINTRIMGKSAESLTGEIRSAEIEAKDGGSCLGWITNGTYAYYGSFDFGGGANKFIAHVASIYDGSNVEVRLDSPGGMVVGRVSVPNTGAWEKFQTIETPISTISGRRSLYLVFTGISGSYILNLAWFEFSNGSGSSYSNPPPSPSPVSNQPLPPVDGSLVFNNWNKAMVYNGASAKTYFYLAQQTTITRVMNYHWNSGNGNSPGTVGIKYSNGNQAGSWQAIGTSGTGGAQNVNWVVSPNVTLEPGLYEITDSQPATWSQNNGSFGCGFTMIWGR